MIEPRRSASTIGIDARIEPRANQRFDAGEREFLIFGIRQVNDLGDEVARKHLAEIVVGELERNEVVRDERFGARRGRRNFERWIQLDAGVARNVGELQAIDRGLREVVFAGDDQRFGIEHAVGADIPVHAHAFGADEADLRSHHGHHAVAGSAAVQAAGATCSAAARSDDGMMIAGQHDAGAGAFDAGTWVHEHLSRRQHIGARLENGLVSSDVLKRRILGQGATRARQGRRNKQRPKRHPKCHVFPPKRTQFKTALGSVVRPP